MFAASSGRAPLQAIPSASDKAQYVDFFLRLGCSRIINLSRVAGYGFGAHSSYCRRVFPKPGSVPSFCAISTG